MSPTLLQLILGVAFLLVSTQIFVRLAEKFSRAAGISPLVVAATLVAIGTSLPELAVSSIAAIKSDIGLAVGNMVGSNVINIFLVFPIGILLGGLRVGTTKTQRNATLLLVATILFILLTSLRLPSYLTGLILITASLMATIGEYYWGLQGQTHEDVVRFRRQKNSPRLTPLDLTGLITTPVGIILGGMWVVTAIENISRSTGYSTALLGLTISAVATSLPELLTTIFSQQDHEEKITLGNIIGSNIYNLLLIGGLVTLLAPSSSTLSFNPVWLAAASLGFYATLRHYSGRVIPRHVGAIFLLLFFVYLASLTLS